MELATEQSLADVCANLEVMASVRPYDKLCIVPKPASAAATPSNTETRTVRTHTLNIDQRFGQCVRRYMSQDSRLDTVAFAHHVLVTAEQIALAAFRANGQQLSRKQTYAAAVAGQPPPIETGTRDIFVLGPLQVMEMLKTKLDAAAKGMETLKATTYKTDTQTGINLQTEIIDPAKKTVQTISRFFTD